MPVMPGKEQLGAPPSGRSGRMIATYSAPNIEGATNSIAAGLNKFAGAIENREAKSKTASQEERFETARRFQEFNDSVGRQIEEMRNAEDPGAFGHRDRAQEFYMQQAKSFFGTVPDPLKPEYDQRLYGSESSFVEGAHQWEKQQRIGFFTEEVNKAITSFENEVHADPGSAQTKLNEAYDMVDNIPDEQLPGYEKEKLKQGFRKKIQIASLYGMDPEERLAKLGRTPNLGSLDIKLPRDVKQRTAKAMSHFREKHRLSPVAASAIVGHLIQESGLDPTNTSGDDGTSAGMMQARLERQDNLRTFAQQNGVPWTDFHTQLDFIVYEMQSGIDSGAARAWEILSDPKVTLEEATAAFMHYERPRHYTKENPRAGHGWAKRLANAKAVYADFGSVQGGPAILDMDVAKTFGADEIPLKGDLEGVSPIAVEKWRLMQNMLGRQFNIKSGHRTKEHNEKARGADQSQHLHGNAMDIETGHLSNKEKIEFIRIASSLGFTGIGVYNNNIHLDIGPRRAWGPSHSKDSIPVWAKEVIDQHMQGAIEASTKGPIDPFYADMPWQDMEKVANQAHQEIRAREKAEKDQRIVSEFQMSNLIASDIASVRETGQGQDIDPIEVQNILGTKKALEYVQKRAAATAEYEALTPIPELPFDGLDKYAEQFEPTPGSDTFAAEEKLHTKVEKAVKIERDLRVNDPAKAVENHPMILALGKPNDEPEYTQALARARLAAQEKLGIPEAFRSPVTKEELKALGAPLKRPDWASAENLAKFVEVIQSRYGEEADTVLNKVIANAVRDAVTGQQVMNAVKSIMARGTASRAEIKKVEEAKEIRDLEMMQSALESTSLPVVLRPLGPYSSDTIKEERMAQDNLEGFNKPKIENEDGTFSTEETITIDVERNGKTKWVNIPTIINGARVDEETAIDSYLQGENESVGEYDSLEAATKAAKDRSDAIGRRLLGKDYLVQPPKEALDYLKKNPDTVDQFIQKFGWGPVRDNMPNLLPPQYKGVLKEKVNSRGR